MAAPTRGDLLALVLYQPWAGGVAAGLKGWETRPAWAMRLAKHEGEDLVICAAAAGSKADYTDPVWDVAGAPGNRAQVRDELRPLQFGKALCVVRIGAVVPIRGQEAQFDLESGDWIADTAPWYGDGGGSLRRIATTRFSGSVSSLITDLEAERPWGDWTPGRVGIELTDRRVLTQPVPVRGFQQAFRLSAEEERHVKERMP